MGGHHAKDSQRSRKFEGRATQFPSNNGGPTQSYYPCLNTTPQRGITRSRENDFIQAQNELSMIITTFQSVFYKSGATLVGGVQLRQQIPQIQQLEKLWGNSSMCTAAGSTEVV